MVFYASISLASEATVCAGEICYPVSVDAACSSIFGSALFLLGSIFSGGSTEHGTVNYFPCRPGPGSRGSFASVTARLPKSVARANLLLTPDVRASLPAAFLHQLQAALAQSLFWVYGLTLVMAAIGLAAMFFFPGGRADKHSYKSTQEKTAGDSGVSEPSSFVHA